MSPEVTIDQQQIESYSQIKLPPNFELPLTVLPSFHFFPSLLRESLILQSVRQDIGLLQTLMSWRGRKETILDSHPMQIGQSVGKADTVCPSSASVWMRREAPPVRQRRSHPLLLEELSEPSS
jgi:hypothetical protein